MPPSTIIVLLLTGTTLLTLSVVADNEEDFAFDVAEDLEVEFEGDKVVKWNEKDLFAYVGKTFHLVIPKDSFKEGIKGFEAKKHTGKGLPSWLLFDKKGGVFWGVPLEQDFGNVQLSIRAVGVKANPEEITIKVVKPTEEEQCDQSEEKTVLTLLLDKNIRAIKPKQRVIAINNIAKFFGLPYSAFTLKPQIEKDDITDSSVVLAGPGNLQSRTSKVASLLQVAVGCDGKLWPSTASMVHQLKQQARDGTIAEVLRLPLIGWRVKTETKPIVRTKRGASDVIDDYGSGDYNDEDEYYDDYEDAYDGDDLGEVEKSPPSAGKPVTLPASKKTTTTTTTTVITTSVSSESTTHQHRHHHGELNPSIPNLHHQTTHKNFIVDESVPVTIPPTISESNPSTSTTTNRVLLPNQGRGKATQPDDILTNEEENYDYGEYDDEDDDIEDPVESETIIPDPFKKKPTFVPTFEDTESITTEQSISKTTSRIETETEQILISSTTPIISTTTTSTTTSTTPITAETTLLDTTPSSTASTATTSVTTESTTIRFGVDIYSQANLTTVTEKSSPTTPPTTEQKLYEATTPVVSIPPSIYSLIPMNTSSEIFFTSGVNTTTSSTTQEAPITVEDVTQAKEEFTTQRLTTVREVTEIEYHENFDPFIENRLQQMSVIAGKIFRFVIPINTFKDFEDEYDLTYQLLDSNNKTITNNSWLHFNPARREVYGLPLEEDVSKWVFWVKAFDKDGGSVQEKLNIQVQQHKLDLVVNHEFSLLIRIEKHQEFLHYVDWSLKVLRALGKIYNTNMAEITVRRINYTAEPVIFTWSNDSIPTNYCPRTEIVNLFQVLTANDRGDPSRELNIALSPELRVKKVIYRELGVCEQPITPITPPMNFSPILRNPVDKVNATVGELLIYKVRDDTFYDPEDVDPRMLNISLLTGDRHNIPADNWLQFDNKNREFFGIPRKSGRSEYQLVCVDSGGLPATDSLEVVVYPASKRTYNVEFSLNITEIPHEMFINSASLQKKFVEKLMQIFDEQTPSNFHILPFKRSYESTVVTWYNKSLSVSRCPHDEIRRMENILYNSNDRSVSHRVHSLMEPEFRVSTIRVHPIGNCKPRVSQEPRPEITIPMEETTPQSSSDDYTFTFIIPAVIISIMLFLAALAALILYRKKRMGKMSIEEDGRQSYGNKGIPVIFQEELEEKPEPGTKAPVILKDEKPPLAPPEYSKSGSVKLTDDSEPYQPPPPFTRTQDNGRQSRPKPTPTYRKPPPYVPP